MARRMKDSGIEWIGEIPDSWDVKRGKSLFTQRSEKGNQECLQLLSPTQKYGVIPQAEYEKLSGMKAVKLDENTDLNQLKTVHKGDFCISLRSFQGGFEYSEYEGVVSPAYQIFYPFTEVHDKFYKFLFKTPAFIEKMNSYTMSLRDGKNIAFSDFANSRIPVPPLSDQHRIAAYLDTQCAKIDAVLEQTRNSIEEYKKLKQAVITQAVTKGIRPGRRMKDSGIEWIGEIPESWTVIKVKWLLGERKDRSEQGKEESLSMSQKYGLIPTKEMDMIPNMAASFVGAKLVHKGDLVFNKLKAHLGVFSVSKFDGLVSPDYAVYYSTGRAIVKFLEYLFKTPQYIAEFKKKSTGVGAGLMRLYTSGLFSIACALPPDDEQREIVEALLKKQIETDKLISKKEMFLSELESYKKSLIYECVTGKRTVK